MALSPDGELVVTQEEKDTVLAAISSALAIEQQRRPNDNVVGVGAHLITAQTPFKRSTVHHALIALRQEGLVFGKRDPKNVNTEIFGVVEGEQ